MIIKLGVARTLLGNEALGAAHQTVGERGVRDETDAGGLERAEEDVGNGLGAGGGHEVDGGLELPGLLNACSPNAPIRPQHGIASTRISMRTG